MAETALDLRHEPKRRAYGILEGHAAAVLAGVDDEIMGMSTIASLVHNAFGHLWTGFYRVVGGQSLHVGPYQGTVGCLTIAFGQGVCGTAASEQRTVIVPDVSKFPGHIACDARARSEIVVPVFDAGRSLIAVFDVDSEHLERFDDDDRRGLEVILTWFTTRTAGG
jgi:GAF domain-containing protein